MFPLGRLREGPESSDAKLGWPTGFRLAVFVSAGPKRVGEEERSESIRPE